MDFQNKLKILKELNFPTSNFVVCGSGSLAIRKIRDTKDLDVVVTQSLWNDLISKYKVELNEQNIERIDLGDDIEILTPIQSLFSDSKVVPIEEIFERADVFDGIKFINLEHLKKIKCSFGREKDLKDIALIDKYLHEQREIKSLESEGYDKVWVYEAELNEIDEEHTHPYDTKLKILEGGIRIKVLDGGTIKNYTLKNGDNIEIPRSQIHSAVVDSEGCRYIVAERN